MGVREKNFIFKRGVHVESIMYLTHKDRKTTIHFENGDELETFHPMKNLIAEFPEGSFEIINKGIAVAPAYTEKISDNVYTMKDGKTFTGRVRSVKFHRENEERLRHKPIRGWDQFSVLDNMPIGFCIIELVFSDVGKGFDFIFRYCNKEMENLEKKSIDEMINKSFYSVFENGDRKWVATYADIALNGGYKIVEGFSPEIGEYLKVFCYQPKPNFCACALIKV